MSTLHSNLCARYGEYLSLNSSPRLFSGLRELNVPNPLNRWASSGVLESVGVCLRHAPSAVNRLTKRLPPRTAIIVGFAMASLCWLFIGLHPTIWTIIAGLAVFSIGEMTQAPRYYEYISDLAPKGQQGLFQGYAFLPVAIAWIIGGPFGGWLYANYAKQSSTPETVWFVIFGVGVIATILMAIYNSVVENRKQKRHKGHSPIPIPILVAVRESGFLFSAA